MSVAADSNSPYTLHTLSVTNTLTAPANAAGWTNKIHRSILAQDAAASLHLPLRDAVEHDDVDDPLPDAAAGAYLGRGTNDTFGTNHIILDTGDVGGTNSTMYARWPEVMLPADYDDGHTLTLTITGAVTDTLAQTSLTLDVECYQIDGDGTVTGDEVTTAAIDVNENLGTYSDREFTIDPTGLTSGTILDIRIAVAYNDGTVNVVHYKVAKVILKYDRR